MYENPSLLELPAISLTRNIIENFNQWDWGFSKLRSKQRCLISICKLQNWGFQVHPKECYKILRLQGDLDIIQLNCECRNKTHLTERQNPQSRLILPFFFVFS